MVAELTRYAFLSPCGSVVKTLIYVSGIREQTMRFDSAILLEVSEGRLIMQIGEIGGIYHLISRQKKRILVSYKPPVCSMSKNFRRLIDSLYQESESALTSTKQLMRYIKRVIL